MGRFFKVIGLLLVIAGSVVAIFWQKGSYGLQPGQKTCYGLIPTREVLTNFPDGNYSYSFYERVFVYQVDSTEKVSYCLGHIPKE